METVKQYFWKMDLAKSYKETRNGMCEWEESVISPIYPWASYLRAQFIKKFSSMNKPE